MKYTCTDCGGEQEGVEGALLSKGWVLLSGSPLCPVCVKLRRCLDRIAEENVILKDMERSESMNWKTCGCNAGEACDHAGEVPASAAGKAIRETQAGFSGERVTTAFTPDALDRMDKTTEEMLKATFTATAPVDKRVMGGPAGVVQTEPSIAELIRASTVSALVTQVGGGHYKDMKIQPVEYIHKNGIGFAEGCVIKYVSRWRAKGGVEDLKKARHFLDLLIEMEGGSP